MERAQLVELLGRGLSIKTIARITQRSPSTVSYWLHRHGLEANGAARFGPKAPLDPVLLTELAAQGLSVPQIAERVERTPDVVRRALRRHSIETRGDFNRQQAAAALAAGERLTRLRCRHHGLCDHVLETRGAYRCMRCRAEQVSSHRRRIKRTLIEEAGGACVLCGYHRCDAALQFHHLDPADKQFHLSLRGVTRSWEMARREAAKCALLCANCHAEVEVGYSHLDVRPTETPRGGLEPPNLD